MDEPPRACWGCGKKPPEGIKFVRCERCVEQKLPSSYFCGEACMLLNWPRHKAWHKAQKEAVAEHRRTGLAECDRAVAEQTARLAEDEGNECARLHARALSLANDGDFQAAVKAFRKCIKMFPLEPAAYADLATALTRSSKHAEAIPVFLKAKEVYMEGSQGWAKVTASCFHLLQDAANCDVPKPDWWNDKALKALSSRVVAVSLPAGDSHQTVAFSMRAQVLAANGVFKPNWNKGTRTVADLREAAVFYRRAAANWHETLGAQEIQAREEVCAQRCDKAADHLVAEAEAARKVAEAEAKAEREAAEAKAAAAAEELLAEEEKEQEQAAAKNKAANAKGKGKKGKGKRS